MSNDRSAAHTSSRIRWTLFYLMCLSVILVALVHDIAKGDALSAAGAGMGVGFVFSRAARVWEDSSGR